MKTKQLNRFVKPTFSTKTVSLLVAVLFLTTALPLVAAEGSADDTVTIEETLTFLPPILDESNDMVTIQLSEAETTTMDPGAPMLPRHVYITELPFGSTKVDVQVTSRGEEPIQIQGTIAPAPIPVPVGMPDRDYTILGKMVQVLYNMDPDAMYRYPETIVDGLSPFDMSIYGQPVPYGTTVDEPWIYVGRNSDNEMKTFAVVDLCPVTLTNVAEGTGIFTSTFDVTVTYTPPDENKLAELSQDSKHDFLIIAPKGYLRALQPLVAHKANLGWDVKLLSLDDIYAEQYFTASPTFSRDDGEKVKYFLYQALLHWNTSMVLAVGGWRTFFGLNIPAFTFPVRFSHCSDLPGGEPGYVTDQYFSTLLKYDILEGWVYDSWDTNNNDIFGELGEGMGIDRYDPVMDISFGRLACRNIKEVENMVNKIIFYESNYHINEPWFNSFLTVTGDGFQDLGFWDDLDFPWDVNTVPSGQYTIYAQSNVGDLYGPIDAVPVTVDHSAPAAPVEKPTTGAYAGKTIGKWFLEDDHLYLVPLDPEQPEIYPAQPVAEIVVPGKTGIVLGNTDLDNYNPPEAYISDSTEWGLVSYTGGILTIKLKGYDPSEKGYTPVGDTSIPSRVTVTVWINASNGTTVLGPTAKVGTMYYEGESQAGHALHEIPDVFNGNNMTKIKAWTSNGNFMRMRDILDYYSRGHGGIYFTGHSSCMAWGDHFPGVPGGRANGMVNGIAAINMKFGLERYQAKEGDPLFPIDQLTNGHKLPVLWLSGCHSGQFDTSITSLLADPGNVLFGSRYGSWTPEGMAWWQTRIPQGGSIATFGNTGLGYGAIAAQPWLYYTGFTFGLSMKLYYVDGVDIIGYNHRQTVTTYGLSVSMDSVVPRKTYEGYCLLGDPSLKIGGYESFSGPGGGIPSDRKVEVGPIELDETGRILETYIQNNGEYTGLVNWQIRITGISPLGQFVGMQPGSPVYELLRGRVMKGGLNTGSIALSPGERKDISSDPIFGFGHFMVNVSVYDGSVLIGWMDSQEDGFLLGNRMLLFYGKE